MLILECQCGLPTHREGLKGQKVKKILSVNIDAGNMKFGQNVYFCPGRTNPSIKIQFYLSPPQKPQK
jgi:hypothetical protein